MYRSTSYLPTLASAQIEIVNDAPLRDIISALGGWPVTVEGWGEGENATDVPPLETLLALLKRNFTLGALLEEWIGPDDRHSTKHVVQVCSLVFLVLSR